MHFKRLYVDVLLSVVVFNQEASLLYTRFCFTFIQFMNMNEA